MIACWGHVALYARGGHPLDGGCVHEGELAGVRPPLLGACVCGKGLALALGGKKIAR